MQTLLVDEKQGSANFYRNFPDSQHLPKENCDTNSITPPTFASDPEIKNGTQTLLP